MQQMIPVGMEAKEELMAFDLLAFPSDPFEEEAWNELLADKRTHTFIIREEEQIVSFISVYDWNGEKDYVKIMTIGTHPQKRQQGYASILMQYVIDKFSQEGMYRFLGETRVSNKPMQHVFENFGFKQLRIEKDYYDRPDEDGLKYGLEITVGD